MLKILNFKIVASHRVICRVWDAENRTARVFTVSCKLYMLECKVDWQTHLGQSVGIVVTCLAPEQRLNDWI